MASSTRKTINTIEIYKKVTAFEKIKSIDYFLDFKESIDWGIIRNETRKLLLENEK